MRFVCAAVVGAAVAGLGVIGAPVMAASEAGPQHSGSGVVASARVGSAAHRAVLDRLDGSGASAAKASVMSVPARSVVTFTVSVKTYASAALFAYPHEAGAYYAYYLPRFGTGEALLPDPGSAANWPATLFLVKGHANPFPILRPGKTYRMLVAVEHASKVPTPFPLHVVAIHRAYFPVHVVDAPLHLPLPVNATASGSTSDRLGRLPLSATAIGIDYSSSLAPVNVGSGDACPTPEGSSECASESNGGFASGIQSLAGSGAGQMLYGRTYDHPAPAAQITGQVYNAPTLFESATLYGFSLSPIPAP